MCTWAVWSRNWMLETETELSSCLPSIFHRIMFPCTEFVWTCVDNSVECFSTFVWVPGTSRCQPAKPKPFRLSNQPLFFKKFSKKFFLMNFMFCMCTWLQEPTVRDLLELKLQFGCGCWSALKCRATSPAPLLLFEACSRICVKDVLF